MRPAAILRVHLTVLLALAASACASFREPAPFDDALVRDRAVMSERDGVRVSSARLTPEEIESIFSVDLLRKNIEPVWLEIENRSDRPLYFLLTGLDAEYFAPREVGYAFHSMFSAGANQRLDAHLVDLSLDYRSLLAPGTSRSGFIFVQEEASTVVVNVDLIGEKWSTSLTLFVPEAGSREAARILAEIETRFSEPELVHIDDDGKLREALEGLPCCAQDSRGGHVAPLNMVLIGELPFWVSALERRGYRYRRVSPLRAFLRSQDMSGAKEARWIDPQPHVVRLWQTPLRFRSAPVWLAQVSTPRGGRFAEDRWSIEPAADASRNTVLEDLMYSQQVAKIGLVKGAGCAQCAEGGLVTDGLRVTIVCDERAISVAEIDFFDWERIEHDR